MNGTRRYRLGIWLERHLPWLRPVLTTYSHEYPEGKKHYLNRISGTFWND